MDSAVLLDLLGNENRRRILRLLSQKPCYVTEISDYLGVSPKAVIDHLRKLEEAGLIESRTDDQRRKYFHITRSLRLEVDLSPHSFGAKSAYPASSTLDMSGRCPHLSLDEVVTNGCGPAEGDHADDRDDGREIESLAAEFGRLQSLDRELSLAQRWVHGRLTETLDELTERTGIDADGRFYAKILAAIAEGDSSTEAIEAALNAPPEAVDQALRRLAEAGILRRDGEQWTIRG
ncbi:ArsR/SmtB family transcription factor [Halohasta salina]|uniref:ArsR/SmtB family transcription factor n=1 Tax=Halohasta salina TaxID=2961621 RepID=UPI0020A25233|nr:ArsR family transcriptional regulator [Halohasta salina]